VSTSSVHSIQVTQTPCYFFADLCPLYSIWAKNEIFISNSNPNFLWSFLVVCSSCAVGWKFFAPIFCWCGPVQCFVGPNPNPSGVVAGGLVASSKFWAVGQFFKIKKLLFKMQNLWLKLHILANFMDKIWILHTHNMSEISRYRYLLKNCNFSFLFTCFFNWHCCLTLTLTWTVILGRYFKFLDGRLVTLLKLYVSIIIAFDVFIIHWSLDVSDVAVALFDWENFCSYKWKMLEEDALRPFSMVSTVRFRMWNWTVWYMSAELLNCSWLVV